jgi:hypothetical protein
MNIRLPAFFKITQETFDLYNYQNYFCFKLINMSFHLLLLLLLSWKRHWLSKPRPMKDIVNDMKDSYRLDLLKLGISNLK